MELLAPIALAAVGSAALSGYRMRTGGMMGNRTSENDSIPVVKSSAPRIPEQPLANTLHCDLETAQPEGGKKWDPVKAFVESRSVGHDAIPMLETVNKNCEHALNPEDSGDFQYDQQNRGNSHLENQWYYSNLLSDDFTPLKMGVLPEYNRSMGLRLRGAGTPEMLKPSKREVEAAEQKPETDRRFYAPITEEMHRRARNESKLASPNGAMDGTYNNNGYAGGEIQDRKFTGYHPRQRFFRAYDSRRQRIIQPFRAGLHQRSSSGVRANLEGFTSNGKRAAIANYMQTPVADGGRMKPHAFVNNPVELRHTNR